MGGQTFRPNSSRGSDGMDHISWNNNGKTHGVQSHVIAGLCAYRLASVQSSYKIEEEIEVFNVNGNSELLFDSGFDLYFGA